VGVTGFRDIKIVGITDLGGLWALKYVANFFLDQSIDIVDETNTFQLKIDDTNTFQLKLFI